ncbi:hypothetical protein R2F61_08350 [Mollicutes bacterium LVI A0078]|nr:hypothetical protein RZE84_08125 [Mollicutes bacterium LVI A0075]WOO90720.1 hypothetical protein R2F61_08350 [Mollicutes bacterium LVI A0078]
MSKWIFKVKLEDNKIDNLDKLESVDVIELISSALANDEDITSYSFAINDEHKYNVILDKEDHLFRYFKLIEVPIEHNKKNKYTKVEIKKKNIERIAKDIGFVNAQQLHATDHHEYTYMPLRQFLKLNKNEFKKVFIYEKGFDDEYRILRHKNLFSKYQDEISDFEKLTTIEKYEPKSLKISYEIDEDIFEYDDNDSTIQERKFMREFAKDIYNKKNRYTERELFEILSGRDLYIQVISTTPKEHKDVWSKVELDQMDIRLLEKSRSEYHKQNVPENKKRKYLSKKQKVRKKRRIEDRQKDVALREYYEYDE